MKVLLIKTCSLSVVYEGSRVAPGHGLLIRSVGGRDADVNQGVGVNVKKTYFTFRKGPQRGEAHFRGMAITDLCVIYTNKVRREESHVCKEFTSRVSY